MRSLLAALIGLATIIPATAFAQDAAQRAISLDFCADQYLIALAERDQIAAVSRDADDDYSYLRAQAAGLRQIRPSVEEAAALQPDLVVRQWGGGPRIAPALERVGARVHQLGYATSFADIETEIETLAALLGRHERGADMIADMRRRRAELATRAPEATERTRALYVTPGGATAGAGTFINAVIEAGGVINIAAESGAVGWSSLRLEELAAAPPELAIASFFDVFSERANQWSAARHPVMQRTLSRVRTVEIPGAVLACPAWFALDAAEAIANSAQSDAS